MGVTHVTTQIFDLNKTSEPYEAEFLVDTGAIDCLAPAEELEKIGIRKEGKSVYELAKEIVVSCLDVEDILDNASDEPIVFLNHQNQAHYIKLLKQQIADYYNGRP